MNTKTQWQPPGEFDGYTIVRLLGQGGMGQVYLGHEGILDRPVALKFLLADAPDGPQRQRFLVEARAAARLRHPNVVTVYRVGELSGRAYIACEYLLGESLDKVAKPLPWTEAAKIGLGVARGLAAAHAEGVLHRDIKPANVFLTRAGEVKLLDFGVAKLRVEPRSPQPVDPDRPAGSQEGVEHARTGILGTPRYMAPEVGRGAGATERSDIFSLGLFLYELLSGALPQPPSEATTQDVSPEGQASPPPLRFTPLAEVCPSLPPELCALVDRCVAEAPELRERSASSLAAALEAILAPHEPVTVLAGAAGAPAPEEELLRASIARLEGFAGAIAMRVTSQLSGLRGLVLDEQAITNTLLLALEHHRRPSRLSEPLADVGRRLAARGVGAGSLDSARDAALAALAELDAAAFTPELERAWRNVVDELVGSIRHGLGGSPRRSKAFQRPATHYTRVGDISIAYQVLGEGPIDLVLTPGWVTHLEFNWEEPTFAHFLRRLGKMARLITFDKRGTGLSDRVTNNPSLDERAEDLHAVMRAARSERAVHLGYSEGGTLAMITAATHPEQVLGLILHASAPKMLSTPEAPWGFPQEALEGIFGAIQQNWGAPLFLEEEAPSRAQDEAFARWWATYLRMAASPTAAVNMLRMTCRCDSTALLPAIRVPTLIMHRTGDRLVPVEAGRLMSTRIPGAIYREYPGADHVPFVLNVDEILDEIERFLSRLDPSAPPPSERWTHVAAVSAADGEGPPPEAARALLREISLAAGAELLPSEGGEEAAAFRGALQAIRAAAALLRRAGPSASSFRIGIHAGIARAGPVLDAGDTRRIAAALSRCAGPGQLLVSPPIRDMSLCDEFKHLEHPRPDGAPAEVPRLFRVE